MQVASFFHKNLSTPLVGENQNPQEALPSPTKPESAVCTVSAYLERPPPRPRFSQYEEALVGFEQAMQSQAGELATCNRRIACRLNGNRSVTQNNRHCYEMGGIVETGRRILDADLSMAFAQRKLQMR